MSLLPELIGDSQPVLALREEVGRLLQRQAGGRSLPSMLIQGETGTGKGLLAAAIHRAGPRRDGPFVAVNCAAIPDTLLEAELFGFERGAFTDARQAKAGLVQTAHRGTLFLDEIGLLPGPLQGKLLTVLEERAVRRLGRTRSEPVDIAILSATSEELDRAVRERRFTEALYHRLSVVTLRLPPLRERGADILLLAEHFLARAGAGYNVPPRELTPEARAALLAYSWPGNVRELSNRMERVTLLAEPGPVTREMLGLPPTVAPEAREAPPAQDARQLRDRIDNVERKSLIDALAAAGGNLTRAAELLGVARTTLRYRLRRHGLGESAPDLGERAAGPGSQPEGEAGRATAASPGMLPAPPGSVGPPARPSAGRERESDAPPGAPLATHRCPNCGADNPPVAEFCEQCGASLPRQTADVRLPRTDSGPVDPHERPTASGPAFAPRAAGEAERRHLTVLSCRLAGSTALSEQLDPEDLHEMVRDFQAVCAEVVRGFEGHIAHDLGDGLLLYFGHPLAHEDDARRAVRTGLAIVEEIGRLNRRLERERGARMAVRVAIHSGVVVVEAMGLSDKREPLALGDVPHIAAQLQELAEVDTVVVSPATHRLIEGYFRCHAGGGYALRGLAQPMTVYRVVEESTAQSRLDVAVTTGLTPLVGREQEIGLLAERWERAKEGFGQVVLLSGEPGIGKSRLVHVLKERIGGEVHATLECRCSPYYQNSAFYPVIDHVQRLLRVEPDDPPQEKFVKLEGALAAYGLAVEETVPLFASLLSLPPSERYPPLALTPPQQRQKTLEALVAWMLKEADRQATLSVWEDLHWADPSTLAFLGLLVEQAPTMSVLILMTLRPEVSLPWANRSHVTRIALSRLTARQSATMVHQVVGGKALPADVHHQLVAKTDGVPLFVEELTKMVLESGSLEEGVGGYQLSGRLLPMAIPSTLHDSLMARIDRLGPGKQVAQLGATLGREFTYDLIQAISPVDEPTLRRELARLTEVELLYQRGVPPQARYVFKHALIQDTAYQSVLRSQRQQYHRQIAQVLTERFPETREAHPELLAHHYTEARLWEEATVYWQEAGQRAIERSAHREAVVCFEQALATVTHLPQNPERIRRAIDLRFDLRNSLIEVRELGRLFTHLREADALSQALGDQPRLGWVANYMSNYFTNVGQYEEAIQAGERALALAATTGDFALQMYANIHLGMAFQALGDYRRGIEVLRQSVKALEGDRRLERFGPLPRGDSPPPPSQVGRRGPFLPSILAGVWLVHCHAELGEFAEAVRVGEEALRRGEVSGRPVDLAYGYRGIGFVYLRQGELEKAIAMAERGLNLCRGGEQPFHFRWFASALSYAYALTGRHAEAMPLLEQAASVSTEGISASRWSAYLSEAHLLAGRVDTATRLAEDGFALSRDHRQGGDHGWILRLLGEIHARHGSTGGERAEAFYRQARAAAAERGMRPLTAQCHLGLGLLFRQQRRAPEARSELSAACEHFRAMGMEFWLARAQVALGEGDEGGATEPSRS
jgi:DNA-binding NtrC family response regulator/class 3 adenylate cyclase/tetratricopeptide (TPR) repeat protein